MVGAGGHSGSESESDMGRGRSRIRGCGHGRGRGRGRGRGGARGRGRGGAGRGRGTFTSSRRDDGLTDRERDVLLEKQDNPFVDPTPGPTAPSTGEASFGGQMRPLVEETNRYAGPLGPWHDVTKEEMKVFVGMIMVMGSYRGLKLLVHHSASYRSTDSIKV